MGNNLDGINERPNDHHPEDFQVLNGSSDSLNSIELNHSPITDSKTLNSDSISQNPITSESSYVEALGGQNDNQPPIDTNKSNSNLAEQIIFTIIILFAIGSVSFVTIKNRTDGTDGPASFTTDTTFNKPATNNNIPDNNTTSPSDSTESSSKCESVEYRYQPTECKGYTISSGTINKKWKKYTINKHSVSFEFPANLTSYGGTNNVDPNYIYEASLYPPDDNDGVITLSSSVSLNILHRSIFPENYKTITLNTQMGEVQAKYTYGPYMDTGGTKYEYEFYYGGKYYYYDLFNISNNKKIMTTDEFRQLIESTTLADSNNK